MLKRCRLRFIELLSFINKTKYQSRKFNNCIYARILKQTSSGVLTILYHRVGLHQGPGPRNWGSKGTNQCIIFLYSRLHQKLDDWFLKSGVLSWVGIVEIWWENGLRWPWTAKWYSGEVPKIEWSGWQFDSQIWNCLFTWQKNQPSDHMSPMFQRKKRIWWESDATLALPSLFLYIYISSHTLDPSPSVNSLAPKFWSQPIDHLILEFLWSWNLVLS